MSSSSIGRRVDALEAQGEAKDRGVAGFVRGRGQDCYPADQERTDHIDQKIAGLHAAGYSVVYVANLARRAPLAVPPLALDHGQRLEFGAQGATGGTHQELAPVGAVNLAEEHRR